MELKIVFITVLFIRVESKCIKELQTSIIIDTNKRTRQQRLFNNSYQKTVYRIIT